MKSVLFLLGRFGVGGVERVTVSVANELVRRGWRVSVAAFEIQKDSLVESFDKRIAVETLSFPAYRWRNVRRLRQILRKHDVDVVINQWALPFPVTLMLRLAMKKRTKLIAFHHTMPNRNNRISKANGLKSWLWEMLSAFNLRFVYRFSDAYGVLSESFKGVFSEFTGQKDIRKVWVIPNPVDLPAPRGLAKENVILYVGRLSLSEKRIDRVIEVWKRLALRLPDWSLEIVGDGPDRQAVETLATGLPRITFCGFQDPSSYYERAKVLLLTSDFEGFGLVLVEAMAYGCVPVAYASFTSVHDIIDDGNGLTVPMPWDTERFSKAVLDLIKDQGRWSEMSKCGGGTAARYQLTEVVDQYESLLEGC